MTGEVLGNPSGDPVVGNLLDVRRQFRLVDRLGLILGRWDGRLRPGVARNRDLTGVGAVIEKVFQTATALFLLGAKTDIALPRVNSKSCLTAVRGRSRRCQSTRTVAAVRIFLSREVIVAFGYPSDGDLLGGLHRHDEQVAGRTRSRRAHNWPAIWRSAHPSRDRCRSRSG